MLGVQRLWSMYIYIARWGPLLCLLVFYFLFNLELKVKTGRGCGGALPGTKDSKDSIKEPLFTPATNEAPWVGRESSIGAELQRKE